MDCGWAVYALIGFWVILNGISLIQMLRTGRLLRSVKSLNDEAEHLAGLRRPRGRDM